jgi:hypothetical protein
MLIRFSIHQINALNSCFYLSKVLLQKKVMELCNSNSLKKEREEKKNGHKGVRDI